MISSLALQQVTSSIFTATRIAKNLKQYGAQSPLETSKSEKQSDISTESHVEPAIPGKRHFLHKKQASMHPI
jgi:hypothetical protein